MSEYGTLELEGPSGMLTLEPADVELLFAVLDDETDAAADELLEATDAAYDGLLEYADSVTGLRDAIHSIALRPGPGA
jgi:hypothetical protein